MLFGYPCNLPNLRGVEFSVMYPELSNFTPDTLRKHFEARASVGLGVVFVAIVSVRPPDYL